MATRTEILAAAERLFARDGFRGVSVRDITAEAGANIAAAHYHFGSKDELLLEIFRTRAAELNRERARSARRKCSIIFTRMSRIWIDSRRHSKALCPACRMR